MPGWKSDRHNFHGPTSSLSSGLERMAELALVRFSLKLVWGMVANRAIANLEHGDRAEEKLRQLLLGEFRKIHEHLNALRRKELVASTAFMENGYELLNKDPGEAMKEFNKARDAAQMAFGVVPDVQDKVLATKILIASALHEFADKPDTATSLCMKYVLRLNTLPEIVSAAGAQLGHKFGGKLRTWAGGSSRQDLLGKVSEVNRCVLQYVNEQGDGKWREQGWPCVGDSQVNPITDFLLLRKHIEFMSLPADFGIPVAMILAENRFFFAQAQMCSQETDQFLGNSVKVLDLDTQKESELVGHAGCVLSLIQADSQVFSSSFDKQILVWDAKSLKCLQILAGHEGSVRSLSANDNHLFSCSTDSTIQVWDRKTYALSHTLKEHKTPVVTMAVSNRHLFSYSVGEPVKYWDLKKWVYVHDIAIVGSVTQMHIVKNFLLVHSDQRIHIFNLGNLKEIAVLGDVGAKSFVVGPRLCTVSDCVLKMWDVASQKCIGSKSLKSDHGAPYIVQCSYFCEETGFLFVVCTVGKAKNVVLRI